MPTTTDFSTVLARLARSTVIEDGDLVDVLRAVTEAAAFLQKPWHLSRLVQVVTQFVRPAI